MTDHDSSYKLLFSHPEMVRDLLVGFVHEEWVARLDFSTLEKVSGSYVGDDLRDREDDIIWKVRLGDVWLYVYLLLEFQSTIDDFMPVRMAVYVISLYQDLRKSGQLADKKLPPVLPLVLYNGEARWSAPLEIAEMMVSVPGLERYQLRMRYLLLDEGALSESVPDPVRNLAEALFRLEKSRSVVSVRDVVRTLVEWLKSPEQTSLKRAFLVWLRRVLLPKRLAGADIPEMIDLHEVDTMLAERVQEWVRPWVEEGIQKGILVGEQKGRQEGKQEEAATILLRLLRRRFGQLPDLMFERINVADIELIEIWTDRVLDAKSLEEVFDS